MRDTARATGLDLKLADQVSKLIPAIPSQPITIKRAIDEVKELGDLYANDSTVRALLDRAQKIEGMTRHASRHACGLVIGEERLDNLVPLEEKDGVIITQYHSKAVEKIGLVKMDMLGLQNNTVINDTLDLIKTRHGVDIDLENIDLTDKKVYDMMGRGDGIAVFQMEGVGMRNLLREMKPENMEHIIAQISLYRPGPMEEIPRYVAGRHGGKVTYPHPSLEPILKNTYGMLLYQEQVMQAAQQLAGFTGGQADELRGALAKKKADQMALLKPLFIEGCVKNRTSKTPINRAQAEDIFDKMEDFARYAFNKSHAAYYGLVSYWTGYLKVNYASEFMACKMTSLLEKKDKLLIIIDDCRKHDIEVLAPDVNESNHDFTVVGMGEKAPIRFGLQAIKGIGEGPVNAILEARQVGGRFISLHDFCERVPLRGCNKSCIEVLVKSGGFDSINPNRQAMLDGLDGAISAAQSAQADALSGQTNMFLDATPEAGRPKTVGVLPEVEDAPSEKKLLWEKEYVGLYISDHPLNPLVDFLDQNAVPLGKITDGGGFSDGARLTIGGLATKVQKRVDKNGRNWAIFALEDLTGSMEVLAFAKIYDKCGACVTEDAKLLVTGRLSADNRGARPGGGGGEEEGEEQIRFKMMADDIEIISDAQVQATEARPAQPNGAESGPNGVNGSSPNGNGVNGNGSNGVKGHVLLDKLNGNGSSSRSNGYSNGNGNGAPSNGSGFSISRSSAPSVTLPPQGAAPAMPDSYGEEETVARIGHNFAPPGDAFEAVHVHVPAGIASREIINRLYNVCRRHPGATELWLHVDNGEEMVQLKVSASYWVNADEGFCEDVAGLLGGENVTVPE